MASDTPGEASVSVNLPESLSRWLDDKASEEGRSREDVLLQLLSAYRKVDGLEGGDVDPPGGMGGEGLAGLPAGLGEELEALVDERVEQRIEEAAVDNGVDEAELDQRLNDVESRYTDLLKDVRDRVVQIKREADEKAHSEHDHPELAAAVEDLEGQAADLETVTADLERLAEQVDAGFTNYEEVLVYLSDTIDQVSSRQTTLAKALVETRDELRKLAARDTARSTVEDLKREANQYGVRTADCEECESQVDVGLLSRGACPHCSATFVGIEPARGFFSSDTLATGDRPALQAGKPAGDGFEYGVDEIIESESEDRPSVEVDDGSGGADGAGPEADG